MSLEPTIMVSRRFRRSSDGLGPRLQLLVNGALHDFVRRYQDMPLEVARGYDRKEGLPAGNGQVLEIDITSKDRMLAHWDPPTLTLLNVGKKAIVPAYTASMLATDLTDATPGGRGCYPDHAPTLKFFGTAVAPTWDDFPTEDSPEWLYYLDAEQKAIVARVRTRLARGSLLDPARFFVLGGPGTGKTSVLLTLLVSLTREGLTVGLSVSDELAVFIEQAGLHIAHVRRARDAYRDAHEKLDALLVDDPVSETAISHALDRGYGRSRLVVVAFDPCQLESDLTDQSLERLTSSHGVSRQRLRVCYRQKQIVGAAAKRVMDRVVESSPFLATAKVDEFRAEHELVDRIANELRFINKGGVERTAEPGGANDARSMVAEIRTHKAWGLRTPSVLVVTDDSSEAARWPWSTWFGDRRFRKISLVDIETVKGLEFQWAVIVIRKSLFDELEGGFRGSSQRVYRSRRLLRIPFTRARDGIMTVVVPDTDFRTKFDPYALH